MGKKKQVLEVERSLLERCKGYTVEVRKHIKVKRAAIDSEGRLRYDEAGKVIMEEVPVEVIETQYIPPELNAIRFYLLNRAGEDWSDPERSGERGRSEENEAVRTVEDYLEEAEEKEEEEA